MMRIRSVLRLDGALNGQRAVEWKRKAFETLGTSRYTAGGTSATNNTR